MIFADSEEEPTMARHIESADLPEDIARMAEAQVAAGRFATVEDVVRAASWELNAHRDGSVVGRGFRDHQRTVPARFERSLMIRHGVSQR